MAQESTAFDALLDGLRAAGDPSRLRLLAICSQGEWTVSELVQIVGQSQPRISRHLKILAEAGLLDRFREGGWVFYRRAQNGDGARIARSLCRLLPGDDPTMGHDQRRLGAVTVFVVARNSATGRIRCAGFCGPVRHGFEAVYLLNGGLYRSHAS